MSEKIGQMTLKKKSLSPETERIMEQEIKSLLDVRHQLSNHLIKIFTHNVGSLCARKERVAYT